MSRYSMNKALIMMNCAFMFENQIGYVIYMCVCVIAMHTCVCNNVCKCWRPINCNHGTLHPFNFDRIKPNSERKILKILAIFREICFFLWSRAWFVIFRNWIASNPRFAKIQIKVFNILLKAGCKRKNHGKWLFEVIYT